MSSVLHAIPFPTREYHRAYNGLRNANVLPDGAEHEMASRFQIGHGSYGGRGIWKTKKARGTWTESINEADESTFTVKEQPLIAHHGKSAPLPDSPTALRSPVGLTKHRLDESRPEDALANKKQKIATAMPSRSTVSAF